VRSVADESHRRLIDDGFQPCRPRIGEYADAVQRAERMRSEIPPSPCAGMTIFSTDIF
jgi:hypothetical protein